MCIPNYQRAALRADTEGIDVIYAYDKDKVKNEVEQGYMHSQAQAQVSERYLVELSFSLGGWGIIG